MSVYARFLLITVFPALVGIGARGEVVSLTAASRATRAGARAGNDDDGPRFAARQLTTVRGIEGQSATLECRVLNLGNNAVLWVRSRDLQILSAGGAVFTADARVSVPLPPRAAPAHQLTIDRLRLSDAGRYECQLNTEPKMSLFVKLIVIDEAETGSEPTTEPLQDQESMWDEADVQVWALVPEVVGAVGGAAELGCAARRLQPPAAAPPLDIRWLRAGKSLTLQSGGAVWRGGGAAAAESRLRLEALRTADAGEYCCAVGQSEARVLLRVQEGDDGDGGVGDIEAMQRDQSLGAGAGAGAAAHSPRLALVAALLARLAVP